MYVFIALCVSTLDARHSTVGRICTSSLDVFHSMAVVPEVAEGFIAVSNVSWPFFLPVKHIEIGTKAAATLG